MLKEDDASVLTRLKITTLMALAALSGVAVGCSASGPTTKCDGSANAVTICLNGKAIDFSAEKNGPHKHEAIYAPVGALAKALNLTVESDSSAKTVTLNGKPFAVASTDKIKGIHVHDGAVFVPVKEFVEAAGLKYDVNLDKGTFGIAE